MKQIEEILKDNPNVKKSNLIEGIKSKLNQKLNSDLSEEYCERRIRGYYEGDVTEEAIIDKIVGKYLKEKEFIQTNYSKEEPDVLFSVQITNNTNDIFERVPLFDPNFKTNKDISYRLIGDSSSIGIANTYRVGELTYEMIMNRIFYGNFQNDMTVKSYTLKVVGDSIEFGSKEDKVCLAGVQFHKTNLRGVTYSNPLWTRENTNDLRHFAGEIYVDIKSRDNHNFTDYIIQPKDFWNMEIYKLLPKMSIIISVQLVEIKGNISPIVISSNH